MNQIYKPSPGGWNRLARRLEQADSARTQELRLWATAACVLLTLSAVLALRDSRAPLTLSIPTSAVRVDGAHAVKVTDTSDGVRYYWLVSERSR